LLDLFIGMHLHGGSDRLLICVSSWQDQIWYITPTIVCLPSQSWRLRHFLFSGPVVVTFTWHRATRYSRAFLAAFYVTLAVLSFVLAASFFTWTLTAQCQTSSGPGGHNLPIILHYTILRATCPTIPWEQATHLHNTAPIILTTQNWRPFLRSDR